MNSSIIREKSAVERFLNRHQQWIVGLVVMPTSFIHSTFHGALRRVKGWGPKPTLEQIREQHLQRVDRVRRDIEQWSQLPPDTRPAIRTDRASAASHSVRTADKSAAHRIGMQDFDQILGIDLERGTVTVEPFVTVGALTSFLLRHDRMLEATLEMEDATLGGLALTQGMTTHSHRCGLVHDTVQRYELVTGRGERIEATPTENRDVYDAAGFSHGSLGFLTALDLTIVPASPELLVTYGQCTSIEQLHERYEDAILNTDAFFLEAIVYSKDHAVLIRGDLLTEQTRAEARARGVRINKQGRWYKTWFFRHAERADDGHREFMPMRDYLMRHDRSMCMTMLQIFPAANHPLIRWPLGWMLPPKVTFLKSMRPASTRLDVAKEQIYQDLAIPMNRLVEMLELVDDRIGIYPLLVYPCLVKDRGGFISVPEGVAAADSSGVTQQVFLNLGIYGTPTAVAEGDSTYNVISETRALLAKVRDVGGFQHSYCDVFQTRDEFYDMFDDALAGKVRARLGSDGLQDVYEKVRPEIPWQDWIPVS